MGWWNKCFWGDSWVPTRPKGVCRGTYKELCERISRNCKLPYLNKTTTNLGERLRVRLQTSSRKVYIHKCGYPASMYWRCCEASEMRLWPADEPPIRLLCRSFIQSRWVCTMRRARAIRDPSLPRGVLAKPHFPGTHSWLGKTNPTSLRWFCFTSPISPK